MTMSILALRFLMALLKTQSGSAPISIPKIELGNLTFSGSPVMNSAEPNVDWARVGLPISVFQSEGPFLPSRDFSARARLGWSSEALLLHVDVTAPHVTESEDPDRLYEGDSVEFMFRRPGTATELFQVVVSPGTSSSRREPRVHLFDYRAVQMRQAARPEAFVSRTISKNGYGLTIALPWPLIGTQPSLGELVGAKVTVNHLEPGRSRSRLVWTGNDYRNDFWNPPVVRLDQTSGKPELLQAWVTWDDDLIDGTAYLMAAPEFAGIPVSFGVGDQSKTDLTLSKDGDRSIAQVRIAGPHPGEKLLSLTFVTAGQTVNVVVPDLQSLRLGQFRSGESVERGPREGRATSVSARPAIFTTPEFPPTGYPNLKYIVRLVGPVTLKTTFFDADGDTVTRADHPGRYMAKVDVQNAEASFTTYLTLFRSPSDWKGEKKDVRVACAAFEGKLGLGSRPDEARKADRDAIHALRKRLGTQTKYEYLINLPTDYKAGSNRRWPLIVYLHGSGGGEEKAWATARDGDGPMGYGRRTPDFPFVTVALRSRGGWFPPAVEDVIDEVLTKYSIDSSRIYLMGFSMGGFGTWATAYDRPDRFAAIAPVAAGGGDASLMPLLKNVPAWVFNGGDDQVTSPRAARAAVEELKQAGGTARYTEYPSMDHGDSLRLAFADQDLYAWLLQFKLK